MLGPLSLNFELLTVKLVGVRKLRIVFVHSLFEPCHKKTCLWGFRPSPTLTGLYKDRRLLED